MTCGDMLTVVGGAAELAGLWLVVREILADRRKAKARFGNVTARAQPMRAYGRMSGAGAVVPASEPTPEERLERLEDQVTRIGKELDDRLHDERRKRDEAIDGALGQAWEHADQVDRELREQLADVLAGGLGRRAVGAALFAIGVGLSVLGNLV